MAIGSEFDRLEVEIDRLQAEIDAAWDALGLADYDGEDDLAHFIARLRQRDERTRAAFESFQASLPPVDQQTDYSAGARYAMITIAKSLSLGTEE